MDVIQIKGATKFTIHLDPSVWIFDRRKIDLDVYTQQGERQEVDERTITGSYGIPFEPFLKNAEPMPEAKYVKCHVNDSEVITLTMDEALQAVLGFSQGGSPLKEDGPVHLYYGDQRYNEAPITHITGFEVTE
ncbi:peptidyl-prolyl cis-trans isomerase [Caldalkalibacillus salinus]|uniref:peptidyl-prolyl cis-trans isomerase n=1 Tax=Caldalkalibacillus salinus TaxID=2803787 RepID=UPI0019213A00|nr:peptidyl-prolyl cis-trans isomerase [Caldalkalibacillus salinus]